MDDSTVSDLPQTDRRHVWMRRWELTFRIILFPVLIALIGPFRLPGPLIEAGMLALGVLAVLALPSHWSRHYRPALNAQPFFAKELTTGDHCTSLLLWGLALLVLAAWPLVAAPAVGPIAQLVPGLLFLALGILLAKCLFPGHTAGLFARAGDERYGRNQAIAHGVALRVGCATVIALLLMDRLFASPLDLSLLVGITLCALQASYHAAMWRMEREGEPEDA